MTEIDGQRPSLVDELEADPADALELAAARGAVEGSALLTRVFFDSGISKKELARRLGVTEERVAQVLGEEVNLRLSTTARYLHAMGYRLNLFGTGPDGEVIDTRRRVRARAKADQKPAECVGATPADRWQLQEPILSDEVGEGVPVQHTLSVVNCSPAENRESESLVARAEALANDHADMMASLLAIRRSGLTQAEVAERMGVTQPTVAELERYDANPTLSTLRRYALAVGAEISTKVDKVDLGSNSA